MRDFLRSSVARVWVPVLALAAGRAYLDRGTDPGDLIYFVHKGEQLLSGGWANTFSDPMLQSGPLQLVVFGAVRNLAALAFVLELTVAFLLLYVLGITLLSGLIFGVAPALLVFPLVISLWARARRSALLLIAVAGAVARAHGARHAASGASAGEPVSASHRTKPARLKEKAPQ